MNKLNLTGECKTHNISSMSAEKLKVLLAVPNFRWQKWDENTLWHFIPYNLCLLASVIETICDVAILDANLEEMSEDQFKKAVARFDPHIVGITVMMDQYAPSGHLAAQLVKSHNRNIKVVIGGVYATTNPEHAISDTNIDFAVIGEGEVVFKKLLGFFMNQNSLPEKGICYRDEETIVKKEHADFIQDLNGLPLPAYHLMDFKKYSRHASRKSVDSPRKYPFARIVTSRGCPCHCAFCQVETISGRMFRARSSENVLHEIQWLKETYGVQSLIFDDDNFFTKRDRAIQIFQGMIERGLAMPWVAIGIAEFALDKDLIEIMRASGCMYIDVAIESGSERVLKEIIRKPVDYEHAKKMIKKAKHEGIFVAANFIIGFPSETWDEIRQTIRLAEEIDVDYVKIFNAIPLPHTRLWELCEKEKCFKKGFNPAEIWWSSGQIETDQFSSRDLTILRAYEWDRINFTDKRKRQRTAEMMGITEKELLEIRRKTLQKAACPENFSN